MTKLLLIPAAAWLYVCTLVTLPFFAGGGTLPPFLHTLIHSFFKAQVKASLFQTNPVLCAL